MRTMRATPEIFASDGGTEEEKGIYVWVEHWGETLGWGWIWQYSRAGMLGRGWILQDSRAGRCRRMEEEG